MFFYLNSAFLEVEKEQNSTDTNVVYMTILNF